MKKKLSVAAIYILVLIAGTGVGILLRHDGTTWQFIKTHFVDKLLKHGDGAIAWTKDFQVVEIQSSLDGSMQKAYYYKPKNKENRPLIVSLHTWNGDYTEYDALAQLCRSREVNYIHPDFRGPNWTPHACCSERALSDIDDAIDYAIVNGPVDTSRIYVIGVSGGGYATLSTFMKSRHQIKKFSAWASISDLVAWYRESTLRGHKFAQDILQCTNSDNALNIHQAREKSPLYWKTPVEKTHHSQLYIYAGAYDGIQGTVPITHSINFYNKLLTDLSVSDSNKYVSVNEKLYLLENRSALEEYGMIAGREIFLQKEYNNLKLVIFEGNHEMLTEYAFEELLGE